MKKIRSIKSAIVAFFNEPVRPANAEAYTTKALETKR